MFKIIKKNKLNIDKLNKNKVISTDKLINNIVYQTITNTQNKSNYYNNWDKIDEYEWTGTNEKSCEMNWDTVFIDKLIDKPIQIYKIKDKEKIIKI